MKRNVFYLLIFASLISVLYSCEAINKNELYYPVINIYNNETFNMSVFDNFEDRISTNELTEAHGKPDTVLTSDTNNYDIWVFQAKYGTIDCYIPKNDTIVEFLKLKPNTEFTIENFIKNKDILQTIRSGNFLYTYHIVDILGNIIGIKKTINEKIEYISLNDFSNLYASEVSNISECIDSIKLPLRVTNLCDIIQVEHNENNLYITCFINEQNDYTISKLFSTYQQLDKALSILMFGNGGIISYFTPSIIKENVNVIFKFIGSQSNININRSIDAQYFKHTITNKERLSAMLLINNIELMLSNDYSPIKFNEALLKNRNLILSWTITANINEINENILTDNFKEFVYNDLIKPDHPYRNYIILCYKCGFGLKYIYNIVKANKIQYAEFNNSELKEIISH